MRQASGQERKTSSRKEQNLVRRIMDRNQLQGGKKEQEILNKSIQSSQTTKNVYIK
jgi:hypothetical protein